MVSKAELRRQLRAARRALSPSQRQSESAATASACAPWAAGTLASYVAMPDELDLGNLHAARWRQGQAVLLPRVSAPGALSWHAVTAPDQLRPGAYGISEPDPARVPVAELPRGTVILVPGVAFTVGLRRLGQGGGFYDRLLAARPDLVAIGIGFTCQLVPDLPCEAHDVRMSGLILGGRVVVQP